MSRKFYEFEHECDAMPDCVKFCKLNGSASSQFEVRRYKQHESLQTTVLYGFKYCPYCGEKLDGDAE